jgi:phosphorylcholine metabolism protein LicD
MKRLAHKIATSFDNKNTIRVANILGYNGLKKLAVPREFFGEPVYTDFEGLSLPVPQHCNCL